MIGRTALPRNYPSSGDGMVSKNVEIPAWWPDTVRSWLKEQFTRSGLEKPKRERLVRLATDGRMKPVADRLKHIDIDVTHAGDGDPIVRFLQRAWEAPDVWQANKGKPPNFRDKELAALARACDTLARILKKEEELVAQLFALIDKEPTSGPLYVNEDSEVNPAYIERGKSRLSTLIQIIEYIGGAALHGVDILPPPEDFLLPRKRGYKDAEAVFCTHLLLREANRRFENLLIREVATTVTVLLNLPNALKFERVKSVARNMRVDYDKPR